MYLYITIYIMGWIKKKPIMLKYSFQILANNKYLIG